MSREVKTCLVEATDRQVHVTFNGERFWIQIEKMAHVIRMLQKASEIALMADADREAINRSLSNREMVEDMRKNGIVR